MPPGRAISPEHEATGDKTAQVLEESGFLVDREVDVEVTIGGEASLINLDVCAIYKEALLVVDVKTGRAVDFRQEIMGWTVKKQKLAVHDRITVIGSRRAKVHNRELRNVRSLAVVLLPTRATPGPDYIRQATEAGILFWDSYILEYYAQTAKALGLWTKYEVMYDSGLRPIETERPVRIRALKGEQPGGSYYFCVMKPLDLLRIAYVYRRSSEETLAYQRIVKQKKIESMTAFLRRNNASLPNNVIVAIDPDVAGQVTYEGGFLTLPGRYCSAWVVDGQHRLYGFVRTKYCDEDTVERFEVPVVIFDRMDAREQTAMFVDINNNQKKIDATLLADLSTVLQDPNKKETWPSLVAKRLSSTPPFAGLVRISEIVLEEDKRPITLAGLSKYALTRTLLGPKIRQGRIAEYTGPLFRYAQFDWHRPFSSQANQQALQRQTDLLESYFSIVSNLLARKWRNSKTYAVTTFAGINALMLVLNRIMETGQSFEELRIGEFLRPLTQARISWTRRSIRKYANWPGFRDLANKMINALNDVNQVQLGLYEERRTVG